MDMAVIGAFLRQLLTIAGTWAVARGWLDSGMVEQLVGAVLVLVSFGWSFWQKKEGQARLNDAQTSPAAAPTVKLPV